MQTMTSLANPRIKAIAALKDKKHRLESGLFWLEGAEFVTRAPTQGWQVTDVLATPEATAPQTTISTTAEVLHKVTGKTNPQPVLGILRQRWLPLPTAEEGRGLILALDRPRDPGNLGTILRTAEAAGVNRIILIGESTDPFAPECVRATMGSILAAQLTACTEQEFLEWCGKPASAASRGKEALPTDNYQLPTIIGTHLKATHDYRQLPNSFPSQFPTVLLMGNESEGLTEKLTAACTCRARIPMQGNVESLNLATATALMLYELQRTNLT